MPQKNLHLIDRLLRGVIGILAMTFALFNGDFIQEPLLEILLGIFGVLNLISLVFGWCPVYHMVGISTCRHDNSHSSSSR